MKEQTKKRIMIGIIIALVIAVIYLLLQNPKLTSGSSGSGTCSGSGSSSNIIYNYEGKCDSGQRYDCRITCTNDREPTTPPVTTTDCSQYASANGYTNYYQFTNTIAMHTEADCRSQATGYCSTASNIKFLNNCCFWSCY